MKHWISAGVLAIMAIATQAQTTCVDPLACNFTELGECEFLDDNGMPCVTEGCAIPGACNFNPEADINDGTCEFTSCLGCTDEAACNYDPEAVYLDLSCIYFVDCNGVCGGDWIEDECGNCYAPQPQEQLVFNFNYSGAPEELIVPAGVDSIVATCAGAQGGGDGGKGAVIEALFSVEEGDTLVIVCGQQGQTASGQSASGGGGSGIFVKGSEEPLLISGGGGGRDYQGSPYPGLDASLSLNGQDGEGGGLGGVNGSDGGAWSYSNGRTGYGGRGWVSVLSGNYFGQDASGTGDSSEGSFGCGGGGGGKGNGDGNIGGGGGGYSGGGAGGINMDGGGGGSFCSVTPSSQMIGHSGDGYVEISFFINVVPGCSLGCTTVQACNFDPTATNDDGSCDFCFCGPGTEYDIELGQCMIVNGSPDINGDGCTNLGDLLDLLSGYGTCED